MEKKNNLWRHFIKSLPLTLLAMVLTAVAVLAATGTTDSAAAPGSTNSYTLENLYQRLVNGTDGTQSTFTEPSVAPGTGTMHDINALMAAAPLGDDVDGAATADVLPGKTFWGLTNGEWGQQTGSMPIESNVTGADGSITFAIPDGYYASRTATAQDSDLVAGNIMNGVDIFGVTGSIPTGSDVTGADGAISFAIPDGYYSSNTATAADSDLLPDNILHGVTIFGVTGNYQAGWNLHTTAPTTALFGVDMLSSTDGWAVGWGGRFYHWDGTSWSLHTTLTYNINDVDMVATDDGWAVGPNTIYRWDGTSWVEHTTVLGMTFQAVSMVSSSDGWAVGSGGRIFHYDGSAWIERTPTLASSTLYDVDMVAANDGWVVNYNGYLFYWDGTSWAIRGNVSEVLYCVDMLDATHGWAGGGGGRIFSYNGAFWSLETDISGYSDPVNDISMVSSTEGWAVGDSGHIFYYDGTTWVEYPISMGSAAIHAVDMLGSADGWAVGGNGEIYDFDGE